MIGAGPGGPTLEHHALSTAVLAVVLAAASVGR